MSLGSAARRLLDPWAGMLLAALVVLAVVILLATPGPWRLIGGADAPVKMDPAEASDVAVFVLAGPPGGRCTAVVWLHADLESAALTATLVPTETRCPVAGGGYAPVRTLVADIEAEAAAAALGDALGVEFAGWVTVERAALTHLLAAAGAPGEATEGRSDLRATMRAFSAGAVEAGDLARQRDALRRVLRALPYGEFKANAVVNYVLGSDDIATDLDLRQATAFVEAIRGLDDGDVGVGVAAAVVEVCGPASSWRLDRSRLESLRKSLALGLEPPALPPRVTRSERAAEVLVVVPESLDGGAFAAGVQAGLDAAGARPVAVRAAAVGGDAAGEELAALVRLDRPIAVVLVPRAVGEDEAAAAAELAEMTATLAVGYQPVVIVGDAAAGDALAEAVVASGAPVVEVDSAGVPSPSLSAEWLFAGGEARRTAARLTAAAVSRACWPDYLAPALAGTDLEFSFAARRGTDVALAGPASRDLQPWLAACGYQAREDAGSVWAAPAEPTVAFRPGYRRAALTVAGDLSWGPAAVVRDGSAPAAVTVVWPAD